MDDAEENVPLGALAKHLGLSPAHFHRAFKAATGLTPREYAAAKREEKMRAGLAREISVTDAIYAAGYGASSRFYEKSDEVLGMTPRAYRRGAPDMAITYAFGESSLGKVLVAQSAKGICAILLGDKEAAMESELRERFPKADLARAEDGFKRIVGKVVAMVDEPRRGLDLPLDIQGTAFQKRVWKALCDIPAGETTTYTALAKRIGSPKAVRAVGSACGANAIGVAIPCHRALRSDGSLAGYYWGVTRKRALLAKEATKRTKDR